MKSAPLIALLAITAPVWAQRVGSPTDDLDKLGVEELFGIQVTSVGRKAEQLSKAPAAVFVLTSEDIRRSGATSIPEALRYVPGMTVLRLDGRSWVVSARGSARLYSDKMLVMIDGRSLYNPLFSGVVWDVVDLLMEDIERIEIVRGPGAVMWGPNAVNGVINIITKKAQNTVGGMASVGAGNERRGGGSARAGFAPSDRVAYRVWAKGNYDTPAYGSPGYFKFVENEFYRDPSIGNLDAGGIRAGFRLDAQTGKHDSWMVQGDGYNYNRQDPNAQPELYPFVVDRFQGHSDYQGGFVQGRWTRSQSESEETSVQFSVDRSNLNWSFTRSEATNATIDVQRRSTIGERHEVYWGLGYQQYSDAITGRFFAFFDPSSTVYRVGDVVARDEWQIVPQRLMTSAGVRLDYSSYGRLEYQPSLRLLYTPSTRESFWVAASRAIRQPSRYDRDLRTDNGGFATDTGLPLRLGFRGSRNMRSEVERSLEAGYRMQAGQRWSVDASVFWSRYERLRILEGSPVPTLAWIGQTPWLTMPLVEANGGTGRSYGGEIWAYVQARPRWRLTPEYSYLNEVRWQPPAVGIQYAWDGRPGTIGHQGGLRSQHDLTRDVQLDIGVRARTKNLAWNLPGALLVDARLGWRLLRTSELSLAAQNLTNRRILECAAEGPSVAIPTRRTLLLKWTQRF